LFLDEPTAGLDPVNARTIKTIIRQLRNQGKTVVLTTHNMYDVDELCDRVCFTVAGRFAALDSPDALKAKFGRRVSRSNTAPALTYVARSSSWTVWEPMGASWRSSGHMKSARSTARKRRWTRFSTMSPA
jgi:ABC-type multidrug transport system ATPase subunit